MRKSKPKVNDPNKRISQIHKMPSEELFRLAELVCLRPRNENKEISSATRQRKDNRLPNSHSITHRVHLPLKCVMIIWNYFIMWRQKRTNLIELLRTLNIRKVTDAKSYTQRKWISSDTYKTHSLRNNVWIDMGDGPDGIGCICPLMGDEHHQTHAQSWVTLHVLGWERERAWYIEGANGTDCFHVCVLCPYCGICHKRIISTLLTNRLLF